MSRFGHHSKRTKRKYYRDLDDHLIQHPVKFITCFNNTVTIIAVHDKNKTLGVLEIMPPQGTNLTNKALSG
jgi:hypothetical protein